MLRRTNFYVSEAATIQGIEAGVQWLRQEVDTGATITWLVAGTRSALEGMIGQVIGEQAARALRQQNRVRIGQADLVFYTERQLPTAAKGAAILLVHPTQKLLNKVDNLRDARSLAVVPWIMAEVAHWISAYGPEDLLGKEKTTHSSISNPVVARAMESIWLMINTSSGMGHPRDRDRVVDAFRILRKGREDVDPSEIRSWLLQKGMKPKYAEEIARVAENPSSARKHSSSRSWADDILEQWKSNA